MDTSKPTSLTQNLTLKPIGFLSSLKTRKSEAPRQPQSKSRDESNLDCIQLQSGHNFEQALTDLDGFSHVWVIFWFHEAQTWKPMIQPPRGIDRKVGVFSSRSPYRPNPIGISLVKIRRIQGRKIWIEDSDLLDGTPILDLKPYVASSDSVAKASWGWMDFLAKPALKMQFSAKVAKKLTLIDANSGESSLQGKIIDQLERSPFQDSSKRVAKLAGQRGVYSHRLWRVLFEVKGQKLRVLDIDHEWESYSGNELPSAEIKLYRAFRSQFSKRNAKEWANPPNKKNSPKKPKVEASSLPQKQSRSPRTPRRKV